MATLNTIKSQLQADIMTANIVTGKTDATMHDAVNSLIDGYGQEGLYSQAYAESMLAGLVEGTASEVSCLTAKSVRDYAFRSCYNLTTVSFPVATKIGTYAFAWCTTLTTASFPVATNTGLSAFAYCSSLTTVSFPAVTTIDTSAFYECKALTTVSFPVATKIGTYAFANCSTLSSVNFPAVTDVGSNAFTYCKALTTASFPAAKYIRPYAFYSCYSLEELYLLGPSVCTLNASNAFGAASITRSTGSIYVPASLYNSYKTATNWVYFSTRFVSV